MAMILNFFDKADGPVRLLVLLTMLVYPISFVN